MNTPIFLANHGIFEARLRGEPPSIPYLDCRLRIITDPSNFSLMEAVAAHVKVGRAWKSSSGKVGYSIERAWDAHLVAQRLLLRLPDEHERKPVVAAWARCIELMPTVWRRLYPDSPLGPPASRVAERERCVEALYRAATAHRPYHLAKAQSDAYDF